MSNSFSSGVITPNVAASTASAQVIEDNQNWMRLSLASNLHAAHSMKDVMHNNFKCTKNKQVFHSWIATANKNKKCKNIQKFVWEMLLGNCFGGCSPSCNGETDLDSLDVTSLRNIYDNLEHIIPSNVMSQNVLLQLKEQFTVHVESISVNRNGLAHYPLKKKMTTEDFETRWDSIRKALVGIGYTNLKDFDDLKTCSLDPQKQVKAINDALQFLKNEKSDNASSLEAELTKMKGIPSLYFFKFVPQFHLNIKILNRFKEFVSNWLLSVGPIIAIKEASKCFR